MEENENSQSPQGVGYPLTAQRVFKVSDTPDNGELMQKTTASSGVSQTNEGNVGDLSYDLRIPQERVAVLIGKDGEIKKQIEEQTKCRIEVTTDGEVNLQGEDGLLLYTTREIVKAIGRGFNPKIALLLMKTDYALEIIDLKDLVGKNKNDLERIKGRVIGKGGKSREELERLTNTYISVYGKTIGLIGELDQVTIARQGVAKLLEGAMHTTVFRFLERKKKEQLFG